MTDNQKKLIFEYCGWTEKDFYVWPTPERFFIRGLNGNDMVEAINKMKENEDSKKFRRYTYAKFCKEMTAIEFLKINYEDWLFGNPENFFSLFGEWLEVR